MDEDIEMDEYVEIEDEVLSLVEDMETTCYIILQKLHLELMCMCIMFFITLHTIVTRHYEKYMLKNRSISRHETLLECLDSILCGGDQACINQIRMDRNTFGILCELLRTQGRLSVDGEVTVEEQVCIFLHILAHHVKNHTIMSRFNRSGETINRYVNRVLDSIMRLHATLLKTPDPVPENCTDGRWKPFKNCLGALDGTYIDVHVPSVDRPRYQTRKGHIATNVLAACSRDMLFTYVLPGWEGSASDSRVLRDAITRRNGLQVPTSYYYLVDAGYANCEGFLSPYRGVRYHLSEWREGYQPINHEEYFNMKHSAARNVIERCFGVLKMRWVILRSPSFYPIKTQCRMIISCCLIHNLIRMEMSTDPLEGETGEVIEIEGHDNVISTIEPSNEWADWRRNLAMQQYNEWRERHH